MVCHRYVTEKIVSAVTCISLSIKFVVGVDDEIGTSFKLTTTTSLFFQVKYNLDVKLVPAISEGYSKGEHEKKRKL